MPMSLSTCPEVIVAEVGGSSGGGGGDCVVNWRDSRFGLKSGDGGVVEVGDVEVVGGGGGGGGGGRGR